jgi:phage/plasmid-like protein (TIGR03299 family)
MAHLVTNTINEKGDLVLKGVPAWHGLGTVITSQELTTAEVLQYSGLDFEVSKLPNTHRLPDGTDITSTESFFTYRTDKNLVLGSSVGKIYTPLQNTEALNLLDIIKEEGTINWESAGALDSGRVTFIAAQVDSKISVNGFDEVRPYVVVSNSHDGKSAIRAYFTNVRVVCNNTLQMSIGQSKNMYKIRHTTNAKDKLKEAFELMGLAKKNAEISAEAYEAMAKVKLKQSDFWNYLGNIFLDVEEKNKVRQGERIKDVISHQKAKVINEVIEYAHVGVGQKEAGYDSTMWGAYNAVTGYFSNVKSYKTQDARFDGLIFGSDNKTMEMAFDLALHPYNVEPLHRSNLTYNLSNN